MIIVVKGTDPTSPSEQRRSTFTGDVWADPVLPGIDGVTIAAIFFAPGARTYWHQHERGQILQVTSGSGVVCAEGGTPQPLHAGDVVWAPPGEKHWHGAGPDSSLSHIAISLGTTKWAEEVSDAGTPVAERQAGLAGSAPPATVTAAGDGQAGRNAYEQGLDMRRAVLGADHVERSMSQVSSFSRPIQELVTEYVWGRIWTRDGLSRPTRSLLNLVMLTALNRQHELAVHVRGALRNGVSVAEIQEALLQTAVYVGAPAALESFRVAERVITEYAAEAAPVTAPILARDLDKQGMPLAAGSDRDGLTSR
jgi:4-carboxymuconolactone decarboxylase